ncbi:hypothetical protein [Flagellimonas sp.]|uniref:hypothetical protein n=1 Tax=Flagellimonas sp. TaxID=2058762 RepID=UPI003BA8F22C
MKNLTFFTLLCWGFLCHASPTHKDTIYTSMETLMRELKTTKKKTATYYLHLATSDDKDVKVRIDLKQIDAEIPIYKSNELDIKKLLALKGESLEAPMKKFEEFKIKLATWKAKSKEVEDLKEQIKTLKSGDSLAWDTQSIDSVQKIVDQKSVELTNNDKAYNEAFNEYEKMIGDVLGNLKNQYTERLSSAIEEAYNKIGNIETVFLSAQDSPTWHDIRINLIKLDARRQMKVSYTARSAKKVTENITAGKFYYILHFAEFGLFFPAKVQGVIDAIKQKEIKLNPFLTGERFALVCDDQDRTQHHINSVINPWGYDINKEEDIIALALNEMLAIAEAHIPYEQESNEPPDYLRTAETEEALAKMDCSEFVSRYLKALGLFDEVPYFHTGEMASDNFIEENDSRLEYLLGSKKEEFNNIKKGDIFLWRRNMKDHGSNDGHTGMVLSYDSVTEIVEVMEALGNGGSSDNALNKGKCVGCTRVSKYHKNGGALQGHAGWVGYFRPRIN